MPNKKVVAAAQGSLGLLGAYALAQENIVRWDRGDLDLLNLWSHFTYQSNLIAVIALLTSTFAIWRGFESRRIDLLRGAATLYMIVTGVVYITLVNNADPAVMHDHYIMHYVMPVGMVLLWLWHRPAWRIPYESAVFWLVYPIAYTVYVQLYGRFVSDGDYLYDILDPTTGGRAVLVTVFGLTFAAAIIAWGMVNLPLRRVTHRVS